MLALIEVLFYYSLKVSIKQTRINKLGKYPYNKNKDHINFEISLVAHLTKFILNLVEGSRSPPTRISNSQQLVMG